VAFDMQSERDTTRAGAAAAIETRDRALAATARLISERDALAAVIDAVRAECGEIERGCTVARSRGAGDGFVVQTAEEIVRDIRTALATGSAPVAASENACQDCGVDNPVWFAPNVLWNRVMGGPAATDDPGGYLCPVCFIRHAEAAGIDPTGWLLTQEAVAAPVGETPRPRRYDQCDDTCTVDCGHCKGAGPAVPVEEQQRVITADGFGGSLAPMPDPYKPRSAPLDDSWIVMDIIEEQR
jgi:hypothetical protein